jgi:multidrug transporter EmrE-like cation transporter
MGRSGYGMNGSVALVQPVCFRESLNAYEIAGLVMAIASLLLLIRFA